MDSRHISVLAALLASRHRRLPACILVHRSRVLVGELDAVLSELTAENLTTPVEIANCDSPEGGTHPEWLITARGTEVVAARLSRLASRTVVAERSGRGEPDPGGTP